MTDLADRDWRLVREEELDGPTTMALEEVAAMRAVEDGVRTVRVYTWKPSTLSLGYRQDPATVDWEYCEREGIGVTRRQTGGGGIYHDSYADISYSIVAPTEELPGDLMDCYELLCEPILDAFERMGVPASFADEALPAVHQPACYLREVNPAHDVVANSPEDAASSNRFDQRATGKLSGNAQYRQRDAVIQHGSLSFDLDVEHHLGAFEDPDTSPDEFRDRVTSIREHADLDREAAVGALERALADWAGAEEGEWSDEERERADELADAKYATDAWTRDRADPEFEFTA